MAYHVGFTISQMLFSNSNTTGVIYMKKTKPKSRHKPPSRIRYEMKNPVFSIRMPQEFHEDFKAFAKKLGLSRRKFMAIALKKQKADYSKVYNKGYNEGFDDGYKEGHRVGNNKGKKDWGIQFPCARCGGLEYIPQNSDCHQAIKEFLKEHGWGHTQCY